MAALTAACARLHDRMDAEMLVKAHWAFARLRHRPPPGDMNRIVGAAKRLVGELPDEDRLTVMLAWGVLRVNPGDDIVSTFTESFRAGDDKRRRGRRGREHAFNPEARLDGASCAKLLCAYGRFGPASDAPSLWRLARWRRRRRTRCTLGGDAGSLGASAGAQDDANSWTSPRETRRRRMPIGWRRGRWRRSGRRRPGVRPHGGGPAPARARAAAAMPRLLANNQGRSGRRPRAFGERPDSLGRCGIFLTFDVTINQILTRRQPGGYRSTPPSSRSSVLDVRARARPRRRRTTRRDAFVSPSSQPPRRLFARVRVPSRSDVVHQREVRHVGAPRSPAPARSAPRAVRVRQLLGGHHARHALVDASALTSIASQRKGLNAAARDATIAALSPSPAPRCPRRPPRG